MQNAPIHNKCVLCALQCMGERQRFIYIGLGFGKKRYTETLHGNY